MLHHWLFPTGVFTNDDYKHIFFWSSCEIILIIQKTLCTPYFSHRVFEEIRSWKNIWQIIKWSWIDQGGVLQNITYVINPRGATVFPNGHTSWDTPLHLYISVMICGIQTVLSFCFSLNSHLPLSILQHWPRPVRPCRPSSLCKTQTKRWGSERGRARER